MQQAYSADYIIIASKNNSVKQGQAGAEPLHPGLRFAQGLGEKFGAASQTAGARRVLRLAFFARSDCMKSMTEISKTIAYVLRQKPEHLGLEMDAHDYSFHLSENGVWLTDAVPVRYLSYP